MAYTYCHVAETFAIRHTHTAKQAAGLILPTPKDSDTDATKTIQNVWD